MTAIKYILLLPVIWLGSVWVINKIMFILLCCIGECNGGTGFDF